MFVDVVLPNKDEEKFVEKARQLGISRLIFLYDKISKKELDVVKKLSCADFKIFTGSTKKGSFKSNFLFAYGERKDFENGNVDLIFDLEKNPKKDKTHYRLSGLNQVLCKLAFEKKITICFSFYDLLKAKEREVVLGRMEQNMHFCKKYKNKVKIASFARKPSEMRSWNELRSFGVVLGLDAKRAKEALL